MRLNRDEERAAEIGVITEQYKRIIKLLPTTTRDRVQQIVHTLGAQSTPSEGYNVSVISEEVKTALGNLSDVNIDILVALIMFELWQSEEEALGELLEEIRRTNEAKQRQRERLEFLRKKKSKAESTLQGPHLKGPPVRRLKPNPRLGTKTDETQKQKKISVSDTMDMSIEELQDVKDKLGTMNEMGEMASLRLQRLMDRRSKFINTLSQMMKKISTTQDTLIQNMK